MMKTVPQAKDTLPFQPGRQRRGSTLVEFTLVAPILFVLVFAGLEFATVGTIRSTSHNAAYEAARKVVIPGADAQAAIDEAKRIMGVVGVNTVNVVVQPNPILAGTSEVTVDITIPYAQNAVFTPWFVGNVQLKSQCTLSTERYQ